MKEQLTEAWRTIVPPAGDPHGPLPPLLLLLTVVTGLIDSFSYLLLGHVFVANMTGNVIFLSLSLGGAPGFVWWASLLAMVSFLTGALVGGLVRTKFGHHRARQLFVGTLIQMILVVLALVASIALPREAEHPIIYGTLPTAALIATLAIAMGMQNATVRSLKVPDLNTTVLTMSLTGISSDSHMVGGPNSHAGRRLLSVTCIAVGVLIGALLIQHGMAPVVLALVTVILFIVWTAALYLARSTEEWTTHGRK